MTKTKREQRPWWRRRWVTWPVMGFVGLVIIVAILQSLNIIDTPEETQQTETAVAAVAINETSTALASITPTLTATSTPTETPTETLTPTITPVPSETPVPSDTPIPSDTPLPSATPTITNTPLPSETPIPTATPGLEDVARAAFEDTFGRARDLDRVLVNDLVVTLRFPLTDLSAGSARFEAESTLVELVCHLREAGLTDRTYQITGMISLIDNFGNTSPAEGVEMILPYEAASQINCDNPYSVNLAGIAERYDMHPALAP